MKLVGVLMCIAGVALGLYAGLWWAFVGGIVDIVNEAKAIETDAMNIALGIAKVVFAGFIGWVSALVLFLPGAVLLKD